LAKTSVGYLDTGVNMFNRAYTLDEIADRKGIEVAPSQAPRFQEQMSAYGY
jgi:hypothetical protein